MPMNDPRLVFEPVRHTYDWEGQRMFGVSNLLRSASMTNADWFTQESRDRGHYIHDGAVALFDGQLDVDAIDPRYRGYFDALFRFVDHCKPDVFHQECRLCDPLLGYAGTGDLVCAVTLQGTDHPSPSLSPFAEIDIKTGEIPPSVGPQTAAYGRIIAESMGLPFIHRACLNLQATGEFKLIWLDDPDDEDVFLAALRVAHWRRKYGPADAHAS